jgi:hypothetical protein
MALNVDSESLSITVNLDKGAKGDTGATGPQGDRGFGVISKEGLASTGDYDEGAEIWEDKDQATTPGTVYYLNNLGNLSVPSNSSILLGGARKLFLSLSTQASDGLLSRGFVYLSSDPGGNIGNPVYLGTSGAITSTAPTASGSIVRVLGYKFDTNIIYFDPSKEWTEIGV